MCVCVCVCVCVNYICNLQVRVDVVVGVLAYLWVCYSIPKVDGLDGERENGITRSTGDCKSAVDCVGKCDELDELGR